MAGEFGKHLRERLPGVLARGDGHQFRVRMVQQQLHQFFAGITGRADDGDFFRFHFQKSIEQQLNRQQSFFRLGDSSLLQNKKPRRPGPAGLETFRCD